VNLAALFDLLKGIYQAGSNFLLNILVEMALNSMVDKHMWSENEDEGCKRYMEQLEKAKIIWPSSPVSRSRGYWYTYKGETMWSRSEAIEHFCKW
jgi:hypothetical protein